MTKQKEFSIAIGVIILALGLHFVPIYSRTGLLETGLCSGYTIPLNQVPPTPANYRVIDGGLSNFKRDRVNLTSFNVAGCGDVIRLRLYIL